MRRKNEKILRPVHPNVGLEMEYRRRLYLAIEQMHTSVMGRVSVDYRREPNEQLADSNYNIVGHAGGYGNSHAVGYARDGLTVAPLLAQDDRIETFLHTLRQLAGRWQARFDAMAQELAAYFSQSVATRSDYVLRAILKRGGIAIEWRPTPAQQEVLRAVVHENVSLIRSIPAHYLGQVEQSVMRSVQTGRDLKQLQDDIMKQFGVAKRRAALIARDQNNKATAALTRARQIEVGVTEAVWMHSGGGKHPRPSHVIAGRNRVHYDVRKGWFDPAERQWILPGQLINCRCVSRSVIKGFA